VLNEEHGADVYKRARAILGDRRTAGLGPIDLSRNPLRSHVDRLNRAHARPPLVSGLAEGLATLLGDASASTTVDRYTRAGGRPLPTSVIQAATEAHRYRHGVGYAGIEILWSDRARRFALKVVAPDDLTLEYASDDPSEPTVIRHRGTMMVDGEVRDVVAVHDLTDLDAPSFRVMADDEDLTGRIFGQEYTGDAYVWRYADGRPFHRVAVAGDNRHPYKTNPLIEAALNVAVRWTAWGAGTDHASHPQRHVRGMRIPMDTDASTGEAGVAVGPADIVVWEDTDPERPGTHWQDAPAFDPLTTARAIRVYESATLSQLGMPVDLEGTGGEPTARELEQLGEQIAGTYAECRRVDSEILRRVAATANRMPPELIPGDDYDETPYAVLYRDEIDQALAAVSADAEEDDNGRQRTEGGPGPGPGQPGGQDPGTPPAGEAAGE